MSFDDSSTLVQVSGLSTKRDAEWVLSDLNFSLPEKKVLGITGPNGGGKSTLFEVFLG